MVKTKGNMFKWVFLWEYILYVCALNVKTQINDPVPIGRMKEGPFFSKLSGTLMHIMVQSYVYTERKRG